MVERAGGLESRFGNDDDESNQRSSRGCCRDFGSSNQFASAEMFR
jgi:hypothetical protein